jgi:hypothetical protein
MLTEEDVNIAKQRSSFEIANDANLAKNRLELIQQLPQTLQRLQLCTFQIEHEEIAIVQCSRLSTEVRVETLGGELDLAQKLDARKVFSKRGSGGEHRRRTGVAGDPERDLLAVTVGYEQAVSLLSRKVAQMLYQFLEVLRVTFDPYHFYYPTSGVRRGLGPKVRADMKDSARAHWQMSQDIFDGESATFVYAASRFQDCALQHLRGGLSHGRAF